MPTRGQLQAVDVLALLLLVVLPIASVAAVDVVILDWGQRSGFESLSGSLIALAVLPAALSASVSYVACIATNVEHTVTWRFVYGSAFVTAGLAFVGLFTVGLPPFD